MKNVLVVVEKNIKNVVDIRTINQNILNGNYEKYIKSHNSHF